MCIEKVGGRGQEERGGVIRWEQIYSLWKHIFYNGETRILVGVTQTLT